MNLLVTLHRFIILLAIFILTILKTCFAQNSVNNQLWFDFNPIYKITDKTELVSKVGIKASLPDVWYKYYINVEFDYKLPNILIKSLKHAERVYGGLYFYFIENIEQPNSIELAPYQGYALIWPDIQHISFGHKVEVTERFQWDIGENNYSFGLQISYEGTFTFRFRGEVWNSGKKFYLSGNIKFWWNLLEANTFNDIARIMPGLGYHVNKDWKAAFFVGWNYTHNQPDTKFSNNNIIYRLRIYYFIPKFT